VIIPSETGVRRMSHEHIKAVVTIHQTCFPDARSSLLGPLFLRAMYRWFMTHQPELSIVYLEHDRVVGFLNGVIGGYGRRMFRELWPVIACCLITHPHLWMRPQTFTLWRSYLRGVLPRLLRAADRKPTATGPASTASVASIAVCPEARGRGIGRALLLQFEAAASALGVRELSLTVEAVNVVAQRAYEKTGWRRIAAGAFGYSYVKVFNGSPTK
jgi:ribosomal protein S18 acetylase RimI-like enzyme